MAARRLHVIVSTDRPAMADGLDAEVIVVGAGVVGAACALRLASAGRDVLLVDAQAPGLGASFGNAGHVATEQIFPLASPEVVAAGWRYLMDADSPLRLRAAYLLPILPWLARFVWAARPAGFARGVAALMALQRTALADTVALFEIAGIGELLHLDGYFRVWESPQGAQAAIAQADRLRPYGIPTHTMSADTLHAQTPGLSPAIQGAVCYPGTGHVDDPQAVCTGLVEAMQRGGGRFQQAKVLALDQASGGGPVVVSLGTGRQMRSRQLVLCAGAWSRPLAASLGYAVPLDTERGYHITLPWSSGGMAAHARGGIRLPIASTERHVIVTPMAMGLRMTGTVEFGGLQLAPDERRFTVLKQQLEALLPGIRTEEASTWMGFRPSLPDHLPVICAAPRHRGVFFAFGHQHLGLTLAGVTARLVAELVQHRAPGIDMAPYHVSRFSWR